MVIEKDKNLPWFNEIMKTKMMNHEDENPLDLSLDELYDRLFEEMKELFVELEVRKYHVSMGMDTKEVDSKIIFECGDVSNYSFFIANKVKEGVKDGKR